MPRVYIGRLSYNVREKDIQRFFSGYGRLLEIDLKNGYGFVEFEDSRDADDAVYELNSKELCGERVIVEHARGPRRDRDGYSYGSRSGGGGYSSRRTSGRDKYGPPVRTEYRLIVENLSSRCSWQDLKDFMRQAGEVTYADAHKERTNEGVIEFRSYSDMKRALDKLDGTEINGRNIRLIEDKPRTSHRRSYSGSRSRSRSRRRSRSRSRRSSRSRSRSVSKSRSRSRSRSKGRSRSRSKGRKSRSKSKSKPKSDRGSHSHSRSRSKDEYGKSRTSAATLGLPSTALDVPYPREPVHVGTLERVTSNSEPVTATILPQLSTGPGTNSTVRLLDWTGVSTPSAGSGLRFRISEYAPLNMMGVERPPCPERQQEGLVGHEGGHTGGNTVSHHPDDVHQDPQEVTSQKPSKDASSCECQTCGPQQGTALDLGSSSDRGPPPFQKRSVIVENSACTIESELLKPMKKRKHREYQSPSEESEPEATSQAVTHNKNGFKVGMKLEGIDPQHPSMYFILTVAEVCGYRLRLHFDGYSECHDFWVNANSPDIHPAGWFEKTGHKLQPPKGYKAEDFSWSQYLRSTRAQAAPKHLFASQGHPWNTTPFPTTPLLPQLPQASLARLVQSSPPVGFQVGMKLEAVDRMNPSLVCVASVTDVVDSRFLVHFDNWDDTYDYWCDPSSPYIHPVGWCQKQGKPLTPPQDYPDPDSFCWEKYLEETGTSAVPTWAFQVRPPHSFLVNMKLEAVDRRNPALIRVASVEDVEDHRIKDPEIPALSHLGTAPLSATGARPTQSPPNTAFTSGKFTAHHCLSGCPLAERNQSRLKADLSDSETAARKKNLSNLSPRKKPRHHGRIGRPPKYHKSPQEDFQALPPSVVHQSLFMSTLSSHPDRSFSVCWEQHCKLLPGVAGISASTVSKWTIEEVFDFVQTLTGSEDQARLFKDEMIDGEAFLLLTQADIVKIMSVKLGPALKIYNAILMFKNTDDTFK
ncbi:hypothetical protein STEG23_006261 [Scotinomys teguina]